MCVGDSSVVCVCKLCCSLLKCVAVPHCKSEVRVAVPRGHSNTRLTLVQMCYSERWGAGVETQKNVRGEIGGWGRVPFNETYAPSLSTIYDGA